MSALWIKNTSENDPRSTLLGIHKAMQIHSGMSRRSSVKSETIGSEPVRKAFRVD